MSPAIPDHMFGLSLFLARRKAYWRIRARIADAVFLSERRLFGWRGWLRAEVDSSSALRVVVRHTLYDSAFALILTAAIWWASRYVGHVAASSNDVSGYQELAAAIASIGGVFIGLYYAAITAAMTAVYATLPSSVSELLLEEQLGNAYMRFVATLTFTAIGLLGLQSIGADTRALGSPLLVVGAAIAIFGFVKLGTWAFSLFDPTSVSTAVFRELGGLFDQVVAGGYKWRKGSFQRYAQQRASRRLLALEQLSEACARTRHLQGGPLATLASSMLRMAQFSTSKRSLIPTTSLWFPQSYSQPEWYRTSDGQVEIAHRTGTILQPATVPSAWWFEKRCEDAALLALDSLLERRELSHGQSIAGVFESYVSVLARHGWVKEACEATDRFEDRVTPAVLHTIAPAAEALVDRVALIDYIGRMRIRCVLSAAEWADTLGREPLTRKIDETDWSAPKAPYSLEVHGYAVETAEWLAERIAFEGNVTGSAVTPTWYCSEMLALRDAEAIKRATDVLIGNAFQRTRKSIAATLERERLWESACLLSDTLHYVRKLQVHLGRLRAAHERVTTPQRVGFTWPAIDFDASATALDIEYKWVVERMAEVIPRLPTKPTDLPDYSGQFLHTATDQVFDCVLRGDAEALQPILPGTFVGCLAKHNELRLDLGVQDHLVEARLAVAFAPILDLVELSGFSYLLSEAFPERPTWPVIVGTWDRFLRANEPFADQLLRIVSFAKRGLLVHPRAALRNSWDREVLNSLQELPIRQVSRRFGGHEEFDHPSAFLREVVHPGRIGSMYDGADIFVAMYLLARTGVQRDLAHAQAFELARRRTGPEPPEEEPDGDE